MKMNLENFAANLEVMAEEQPKISQKTFPTVENATDSEKFFNEKI